MNARRVLLIGGTGVFGLRLARHLAASPNLDLIVTSRREAKARDVARAIVPIATTTISGIGLDHGKGLDAQLASLAPWLVIDASGPFQGADYRVPRAALSAGAHVVDLADARDYILGYGPALDGLACERGLVALTGASSTPALSAAAVAALTENWQRIDAIDIAITPGGRGEVGQAVIAAILSYAGRPIPVWREGELQEVAGWLGGRSLAMRGLGRRRVAPVETVDAQLLGRGLAVRSQVSFQAGLESPVEQWGLAGLAWMRRRGWLGDLERLSPLLLALRHITRLTTSDRGGMRVAVTGLDAQGLLRHAEWSLLAARGDGPHVPSLPAAAALRAILAGRITAGARPAAGALALGEIEAEMAPYAISTQRESRIQGVGIFETALGATVYATLPEPVQALHDACGPPVWRGRAEIETGTTLMARLLRRIIGLPEAGTDIPLTVTIARGHDTEGKAETWTRNFNGRRFSSRLETDVAGVLHERFGPMRFALGLSVRESELDLPVSSGRLFGLPLPGALLPLSVARESVDAEGRFRFDVRLSLPIFGLLAHYRGWLKPAPAPAGRINAP